MRGDLTLRRTKLPDAGANDWCVWRDRKEIVGRIYLAPNRTSDPWFWGLTLFPSSAADSGFAASLEDAFVTIIGIPFGIANLKLVPVSLFPLGHEVRDVA